MPKYATVAFDSASDLCRLYFSQTMQKHDNKQGWEMIREPNHYPGTTERLNMLARRVKNLRSHGTEVVFPAHEQIEKIYAKGGMITPKGQTPQEPIAIKGLPDMPGKQTPEEICRAADNILRVRRVNGKPHWIANAEPIGGGGQDWEVKTRFWAQCPKMRNGILPASYEEVATLAKVDPEINWKPPYIWILYGTFGIGKTRSLESFPSPIRLFDFDRGSNVLAGERTKENGMTKLVTKSGKTFFISEYDVEDCDDYAKFMSDLEVCFG